MSQIMDSFIEKLPPCIRRRAYTPVNTHNVLPKARFAILFMVNLLIFQGSQQVFICEVSVIEFSIYKISRI